VYDAEESIRFFVVPQKPTLPLPREDIMSSPTIYKDWSGIWTRILLLAKLFKMNARLVRALRRDIQPSARRVGRPRPRHVNLLQRNARTRIVAIKLNMPNPFFALALGLCTQANSH
jgi:hypothetical protein